MFPLAPIEPLTVGRVDSRLGYLATLPQNGQQIDETPLLPAQAGFDDVAAYLCLDDAYSTSERHRLVRRDDGAPLVLRQAGLAIDRRRQIRHGAGQRKTEKKAAWEAHKPS